MLVQANQNRPKRVVRPPIASPPIDLTVAAGVINAGEFVYLTAGKKTASLTTPGSSNANAASCIGVSMDTYPVTITDGISGSPVPPTDPTTAKVQLYEDGDHLMKTTAGDSYSPYDTVYLGADGRTISKTATGTALGYVSSDQRPSNGQSSDQIGFPIAGGTGVQIYIRIQPALAK